MERSDLKKGARRLRGVPQVVGVFQPIRAYIAALVHPSVRHDALQAARHRAFIAPRLIGSVAALAALPLYVAVRGAPGALEGLIVAWLVAPIFAAFYLSYTGRFETAHVLSSLALTGLIAAVAAATGGITSFATLWLVIVPLEAALSASRRVVVLAAMFAVSAAMLLLALGSAGALPTPLELKDAGALAGLGIMAASLYAAGLGLGAESFSRTMLWMLGAEEDRYRLLARHMTDGITRHGSGGAVLFASPAIGQMLGTPVNALMGHRLFDRVHVGDRPAYLTALSDAARGETRSVEFRAQRETPDDGPSPFVWLEMRCRPLELQRPDGERDVVAVLRDISTRKESEQELAAIRIEAERAHAAKGRFLATMSHELRTPLNAIIGFSEMLTQETALRIDAERRADYARLINESGNHLLTMVNDILDMSKMETGEFAITLEPFEAAPVIRTCCELLALKARDSGVDLIARLPDDLGELRADKRALKQVMLNLLSNAIKFTDRGGRVTVGARVEGAAMVFTVRDTGIGIGADDLPRIGRPFFQAQDSYDRRHDGTGLGLSIVKGLVDLHGGTFAIDSRKGEGTRVTVSLPLTGKPDVIPEQRPVVTPLPVGRPIPSIGSEQRMKQRA